MVKYLINLNKTVIVSFMLTVIVFLVKAQNKANYLDNYTFFGIHSSFNYYSKGVTNYNVSDSPVTIQYTNFASYSLGVMFQVHKTNRFNFQIGFNGRYIYQAENFHIDKNQFNNPVPHYEWKITFDAYDKIYNIPIRAEYLVTKKLFAYTSFIPGYYEEYGGGGYSKKMILKLLKKSHQIKIGFILI